MSGKQFCGYNACMSQQFPILEFDPVSSPIVQPKNYLPDYIKEKSERCIITYFSDVVDHYERLYKMNQAFKIRTEGIRPRVFYMKGPKNELIYVVPMSIGAPQAARVMEVMASIGVKKFMVCGGAGSLDDAVTGGMVLLPVAAVRDEGTSYHYLPPSREVHLNPRVQQTIENVLKRENEPYVKVKTWTTDAIFRETKDKVALRRAEGCVTVEMECSAFLAVAQHKNLLCGQLLYAGDVVKPSGWSYRDWHTAYDTREKLFGLCVKCLLDL